ncbi:hypothetical protein H4Q26_015993 [Puccinia striiformis f. sp. tritici PST-130]|nr:hypothetical protein H4Q26_015993 [Puccinia striiformis f. sp. tritici PST-130]
MDFTCRVSAGLCLHRPSRAPRLGLTTSNALNSLSPTDLEEKVNLTTGAEYRPMCRRTGTVPRLGFNQPICLQDGPVGIRFTDFNSVFPAGINAAATFDRTHVQAGSAMGNEFKNKGAHVVLAPMTNLMRAPEAGRSWEGPGADPYMAGVATVQAVLGIQSTRASACVKHYIANEQEHFRGGSGGKASSLTSMIALSANSMIGLLLKRSLINGIVKGEYKFQGVLVTDWAAAAMANRRSPILYREQLLLGFEDDWAVNNGTVPIERLDDMVTRVMSITTSKYRARYPEEQRRLNQHVNVQADHHKLIREIGAASTVLLKNLNNTLPLKSQRSDAGDIPKVSTLAMTGDVIRYSGSGVGIGYSQLSYLIAPATAIQNYVMGVNPTISYQAIFDDYAYDQIGNASVPADLAIVHVSSNSGEGYITVEGNAGDRNNISLWHNGDDLILKTAQACNNVVVVIHSVGPVDMEAWIDNANVTAVLMAGLPGQESGNSEVDILWGKVNPSARLPYTIAKKRSDYPAEVVFNSSMTVPQINYSEKLRIDYRHFDAYDIEPRFEYGFVLHLNKHYPTRHQRSESDLYKDLLNLEFQITNTGPIAGNEVAQLYVAFPSQASEPPKVLRGFERVFVPTGDTKTVSMKLRRKDLSYCVTSTSHSFKCRLLHYRLTNYAVCQLGKVIDPSCCFVKHQYTSGSGWSDSSTQDHSEAAKGTTPQLGRPNLASSGGSTGNEKMVLPTSILRSYPLQLAMKNGLHLSFNLTTGAGIQGRCVGQTGTVPRLGFHQPICLHDGPVGVRSTDFNSVFPAGINVAATFDKDLMFKRAQALDKNLGIRASMSHLAGRSWEGPGADPYMAGVATVQSVLGIQSAHASACVKHYIANEQEHYRGGSGGTAASSNIDDRTLLQVNSTIGPFAEAIHAGVDYIMCSYNRLNQTYACENSKMINGVAKGEHKFQGVVVTDWAAAASGVRTTLAGADMNMPGFMAYGQPSESDPSTAQSSYWGVRMIEAVKMARCRFRELTIWSLV